MEELLTRLLDNKLVLAFVSAVIGGVMSLILAELTRVRRKKRLLMGPAMMPSFVLTLENESVSLGMFGDYGIVNMSDLPLSIDRPHLLGYNAASRAFQFKVMPSADGIGDLFEKISVPPNSETVLISHKACTVEVERCYTRGIPRFLWLETLEVVRLAPRQTYRDRAYLYRANFYSPEERKVWYVSTGREVSSGTARFLALPGKLLYRYRRKRRRPPVTA